MAKKIDNRQKIMAALIESPSITDAAEKCGLSRETIHKYLQDKQFLVELRTVRRGLVETAISQVQNLTAEAIETLQRNLHCENPSVEVRAAQAILEQSFKGLEAFDLLQRLEDLENAVKTEN